MPLLDTRNNQVQPVKGSGFRETLALPVGTDPDEAQWRNISKKNKQDLPPLDQATQVKVSRFNYTRNLVGHRLLELMRDYVIGGDVGIRIMANEEPVQEIVDFHWEDPANEWNRRIAQDVLDLSQDGELIIPTQVSDGRVFCGKIDPLIVKGYDPDPFFMGKVRSLTLASEDTTKDIPQQVIKLDRDPDSETFRRRVGDLFFWTINRPSGGCRGISDLFPLSDTIDQVDRFLFARARNAELRNLHIWDVTMTGAGETEINKFLDDLRNNPPEAGSARAHNELVKWQSIKADIQADDASREAEMLLGYVLFGFGIPPTATGIISTGRTALSEQIDMLYKTFSSRAREIRDMVKDVIRFVIDQAIIAGLLPKDINTDFRVILPRIALRDIQRTGGALARVAEFFRTMHDLGIYSKQQIKTMLDFFLAALGFDVPDVGKLLVAAPEEEEEEKEEEPQRPRPFQKKKEKEEPVRVAAGHRG